MLSAVTGKPKATQCSGLGVTKWEEPCLDYSMKMHIPLTTINPNSCTSKRLLLKLFKILFHHPLRESRDLLACHSFCCLLNISVMKDDKKQCNSPLLWEKLVPMPKGKHSGTLMKISLCSEKEVNKQEILLG